MIKRLKDWAIQILTSFDQFVYVILWGIPFVIVGGTCPNADESISSRVGRESMTGNRVAQIAEHVIDALFEFLGEGPNHCRNAIAHSPTPTTRLS